MFAPETKTKISLPEFTGSTLWVHQAKTNATAPFHQVLIHLSSFWRQLLKSLLYSERCLLLSLTVVAGDGQMMEKQAGIM